MPIRVEGIILAAGLSSRANTNKMLLKIKDKTIIECAIESMEDSCDRILIVGGHNATEIYKIVKHYPKVSFLINKDYRNGMFSSVKYGLKYITGNRVFIIPGDYPMIKKSTYNEMLELGRDIIIPSYKGQKGHPILIKASLVNEILKDKECESLRDFINKKNYYKIEINDPGILMDIDTMDDYEYILKYIYNQVVDLNNKILYTL